LKFANFEDFLGGLTKSITKWLSSDTKSNTFCIFAGGRKNRSYEIRKYKNASGHITVPMIRD